MEPTDSNLPGPQPIDENWVVLGGVYAIPLSDFLPLLNKVKMIETGYTGNDPGRWRISSKFPEYKIITADQMAVIMVKTKMDLAKIPEGEESPF